MPTLTEIREGLAANLDVIPGLQASAYMLGNPHAPYAEVVPGETEYDKTFARGLDYWRLTVRVIVGEPSDKGAQKRLDRFLSPSGGESIKATIEADDTLGGVVDDLRVTSCTGYRLFGTLGQSSRLGAEWSVDVWAEGSA